MSDDTPPTDLPDPRRPRFRRKAVAVPLAAVVAATLLTVAHFVTTPDGRPSVTAEDPVPVEDVRVDVPEPPEGEGLVWNGATRTEWPAPGRSVITVDGEPVAGVPVRAAAADGDAPSAVAVDVKTRDDSARLGLTGPLFTAEAMDGSGDVTLTVDYSAFAELYGGGWAGRLRLVELPECAVSTPELPECRGGEPLPGDNRVVESTVSATVPLSENGSVFGLTADEESESGDYKATDLEPTGDWTAGGNSGGFSYDFEVTLPPAEGPLPTVNLAYSSQNIDGRTSGANNQAGWAGDGWHVSSDYIERGYKTCADDRAVRDGDTPNNATNKTYDQCWYSDNATVSLNGDHLPLLKDDETGEWRTDNNWRVERLRDDALDGHDADGEYWLITTTDGTRYYFGAEPERARSTWTVPVFGNHPGEPCHSRAFKDSSCTQAWRWMLDKVVDTSGNTVHYRYETETGHYGAAGDADRRVAYTRGGHLDHIDYGLHSSAPGTAATARVDFTAADRCFEDPCWEDDAKTKPKAENWPDVPWDGVCVKAPCTWTKTPMFFTQKRLAEIATYVREGEEFTKVDSWRLTHESRKPGDGTTPVLWLKSVVRSGHVGGDESMPPIVFTPVGMDNRVDGLDGIDPLHRFRIGNIRTESGADVHITYSAPECRSGATPDKPEDNATRCHPVWWTPDNHETESMGWFHKYVVTSVTEIDNTGGSPPVTTRYRYHLDGGGTTQLWAYDDGEFTERKHRTYGIWRGYPRVTTEVGDPDQGTPLITEERYHRGMHGQHLPGGGTRSVEVTDSRGDTAVDHEALAGRVLETLVLDGDEVFTSEVTRYWYRQTASRDVDGQTHRAWLAAESASVSSSRLAADSWRRTAEYTEYDEEGNPVSVENLGDLAVTGDETCTRVWYTGSESHWLRGMAARQQTVSVDCATTPVLPEDLVSGSRLFYDGATDPGTPPTRGMVTRKDEITDWSGGVPVYVTVSETGYDALGRVTTETDALGEVTTTTYVPAGPGPVDHSVVTDPLGHTTTTYRHAQWDHTRKEVDANGVAVQLTYDPFGRLTGVWKENRDPATDAPHMRFAYLLRDDGPIAVTSEVLAPNGGYTTTVELMDGLYRPRQTQKDSATGGRLLEETGYDDRGQEAYRSGPNHHTAVPDTSLVTVPIGEDHSRTVNTYDALGRITVEAWWSGGTERWRTTMEYGGHDDLWRVAVTPREGETAVTRLTDARDQLVELRQHHGPTPDGDYDATTYTWHPNGERASVTGPTGETWRFSYDLRGRMVTTVDPDGGTTTTEYDHEGNEIAVTDARGVTVRTEYDPLGRETARRHGDTLLATMEYDTAKLPDGSPALGQLATSTSWVEGMPIVQRYDRYDHGYRATRTSASVPALPGLEELAGTYPATTTYHPDGSVHRQGLPALGGLEREVIGYEYDAVGNPTRVVGTMSPSGKTTAYVDGSTYGPYGELLQRALGTGTGPQAYHTYRYQEGTRRVEAAAFDRDASVTNVSTVTYGYDPAGNITSIADIPADQPGAADIQCFRYDHLRRLTEAWTQQRTGCATDPVASDVGGVNAYWNTYTLDAAGNRTGYAFGTGTDRTEIAYRYGEGHRLDAVDHPDRTDRFEYDASGNTTVREVGGARQELVWDVRGDLERIEDAGGTTRMYYSAGGDRLARVDADGSATLFLNGHELTYHAPEDRVGAVRYYDHGETTVASRTAGELVWLGADHQGTTQWEVNAETMVSTVRRQDPYGLVRGEAQRFLGQRGFVGSVTDPTGLSQMGARQYDAMLGRFVSVDPKVDYEDPQRMHAYAYANNSPVTFSDPDGEFFSRRTWGNIASYADTTGAVLGGIALGLAFIPGAQPLAAVVGGAAVAASAVSVIGHYSSGNGRNAAWSALGLIPGAAALRTGVNGVRAATAAVRPVITNGRLSNGVRTALHQNAGLVQRLSTRMDNLVRAARPNLPDIEGMSMWRKIWTMWRDPQGYGQARAILRLQKQLLEAQGALTAAQRRAFEMLMRPRLAPASAADMAGHAHWIASLWGNPLPHPGKQLGGKGKKPGKQLGGKGKKKKRNRGGGSNFYY
ncbi:RHS repeat-associated protein [Stackebrandtia albiflava]|uniref:RHS repeat-associated protein n=1 Tax=Stackebrandtia albiflava TaxID=406432 RepID=A0A562V9N9_9ACTN|nr:RHS repeat-associated core domain-containing protein [Stackebrandtia albiflava]TWJ14575.1 RHS repeat-associated protein [Stackebrandtia albiflava]